MGAFSGVEVDLLREAFEILREGSDLVEAVIMVRSIPVVLECRQCSGQYVGDFEDNTCPVCQALDFDVIQGEELQVRSIKGK